MKIVLVTCKLVMGGIETLLVRMTNWLLSTGYDVTVVVETGGVMADQIPESANLIVLGKNKFKAAIVPGFARFNISFQTFQAADVVFCFTDNSCVFTYHMLKATNSDAKFLAGVFLPTINLPIGNYVYDIFWDAVHNENKVYMNQACIDIHESEGRNVDNVKVWPLPVQLNINKNIDNELAFNSKVILSVGRLTKFKTYNIYMIGIIKELNDKGYDVTWHVAGDNDSCPNEPTKNEMEKLINELGVEDKVKMLGTIDYNDLNNLFSTAKVFVGMGTSIIEASAFGIPSICAVCDEEKGYTYGFLWDQPHGCLGELLVNKPPTKKVIDLIETVLDSDENGYDSLIKMAIECTSTFDMDKRMNEFINIIEEAKPGFHKEPKGRVAHVFKKILEKI